MKNYSYIVNEEKRTVVCLLTTKYGVFRGIAKCGPDDKFDEQIGKELARKRAILEADTEELRDLEWCWPDTVVEQELKELIANNRRKLIIKQKRIQIKNEINKLRNL